MRFVGGREREERDQICYAAAVERRQPVRVFIYALPFSVALHAAALTVQPDSLTTFLSASTSPVASDRIPNNTADLP